MPGKVRSAMRRLGNRIKRIFRRRHKSSVPQAPTVQESPLAGTIGAPQFSGQQTPGSSPGAAEPDKPSAAGDQSGDHDATAMEQPDIADGDRPSSSTIGYSSNPGPKTESPWELAFRGLNLDQREALSRHNFQNQRPSELFKIEIGHIQNLRDRCNEGLVAGVDNKPFMVRGRIHSILKKLEKCAKLGDIAIQHHPEIVALIWAGVRMSLQVALNDLATFDRLSSVLDEIATAMRACKIYENLYASSKLASAREVIGQLSPMYAACLKVVAEAIMYSGEKTLNCEGKEREYHKGLTSTGDAARMGKGITNPFETRFQPLIDGVDWERKKLETYANAVSHEKLSEMSRAQDEISRAQDESGRKEALKWISKVEYQSHHNDVKESRVPGTGGWLFQSCTFLEWLDCNHSSLLWLHGKAGSGKTVLSSKVTDVLTKTYKSTPVVYFYCKFNEQPQNRAYSIIGSLLKQLSVASETLGSEILAAFPLAKKNGNPASPLSRSDAEELFMGAMSRVGEAYVVLDAMDECEERERKVLLSFLRRLLALDSCQVKVFLTSRPEDGLHRMFEDSRSKKLLTYKINVDDTAQDIGPYVTRGVDELIENKGLLSGRPVTQDFRQHLITTLAREADGVFLWARYQIETIGQLESESEIRTQLTQLPKGLEETYIRIWGKIRGFPNARSSRAYRTLMWLLSSTRPLKREEIVMAAAIKPLDTAFHEQERSLEYLVSACGNLVYLDEKAGVLRFVHFSVKEFLVQQPELKDAEGFVTDVCFTALGFHQRPTAIWGYAAYNWWQHARCWQEINGDRSILIERFLLAAPRLKEWVAYFQERVGLRGKAPQPFGRYGAIGVCASFNLPIVLEHLLRRNAEHSEGDSSELVSAALLLAAAEGHCDVVDILVEAGANTCWRMSNPGATPQIRMPKTEESVQLRWLRGLALWETIQYAERQDSVTALQVAVGGGHGDVVKLLLKASVDSINHRGLFKVSVPWRGNGGITCETALQAACAIGLGEVVGPLVQAGATINAGGKYGTPLQVAVAGGHGGVVKQLLKLGADANVQNLFLFSTPGGKVSCGTALQAACMKGDAGVVGLLLKEGATVDAEGGDCGTPLQAAAALGHEGVVKLLLEANADFNLQTPFRSANAKVPIWYQTALQAASENGFNRIVQQLLDAGATPMGGGEPEEEMV